MRYTTLAVWLLALCCCSVGAAVAQTGVTLEQAVKNGKSVLPDDALFQKPVGGLERTDATTATIAAPGTGAGKALRVVLKKDAAESNATQLTLESAVPVAKGEALLASFLVRGRKADGKSPAEVMFLFEKSTDPWTKSASELVTAAKDPAAWKPVRIVFGAADDYAPGQVMASLRFACGAQTVEVADLKVVSLGTGKSLEEMYRLSAEANPLKDAVVTIDVKQKRQTMEGIGGNFCQARYGRSEKIDPVGQYVLDHLHVARARVGLPLNFYVPEPGVYKEDGQAKAAWELMQELARRKIPMIASIWEGPLWMLPGKVEESGRVLPVEKYDDCIAAIVKFLVTARDKYNAPVEYLSFNESDYGVNFKFTPTEMADFIKRALPPLKAAGLTTKFLTADTANGNNLAGFAAPLLADPEVEPFLGPIAFHCWDALSANEKAYTAIADLGAQYHRPVWCTEAGHDAQLWQQSNPWPTWENALRLATAYARTIRLTNASTMLYWTYQDNYPIVSANGKTPYPAFQVLELLESVFAKGATVCSSAINNDAVQAVATLDADGKGMKVLVVNSAGAGKVAVKGVPGYKTASYNALKSRADTEAQVKLGYKKGELVLELPARSLVVVSLK